MASFVELLHKNILMIGISGGIGMFKEIFILTYNHIALATLPYGSSPTHHLKVTTRHHKVKI